MALPDFDAGVGHSFGLEFDSVVIKQIQEVTGLKMEQDVIEMKANTRRRQVHPSASCPGGPRPARSP